MSLSREHILHVDDCPIHEIEVPEWGGTVRIRALNTKEANDWRRGMLKPTPKINPKTRATEMQLEFNEQAAELSNARMLAIACVDEQGKPLFTPADIEALNKKSAAATERLVRAIRTMSGLDSDFAEEAEKNSSPSPSDSSSSD